MKSLSPLLALALLAGCIDAPTPGERIDRVLDNKLVQSSHAAVSVPATIGTGIGLALGFPIALLAAPVTIPLGLYACHGDSQSTADVVMSSFMWPDATLGTGAAYALGSIPNAIVGDDSTSRSDPASPPHPSTEGR